ncbi:MAG: LTA synthase family protein [Pyramidobacter sp.]|uniref:LTA synthase family protein n=1 Tax=Pyramidobacter sp. TaxID=1943581 RepID=UPI002A7ED96F|nr:LTA synthase family protein [Pyramidobacter sp.]MDY4032048.1 LTA synthase family protein [Pyramidobacter sp.]
MNDAGYRSDFVYGDYGYFDNMNEFFRSNGYEIHDRTDIPEEEIFSATVWSVADEILFSQVLKTIDERHAKNEKFFELVMTTSNHRPYTFPEGRVSAPQVGREGACRYSDWAIGDFLARAAERDWFRNTVFVIVADHQANSAGHTSLPVHRYHIPCLVYAPGLIVPGECRRLISQMDLPPTLLGMLGISYDSTFMGRDIARVSAGDECAFISTYQLLGYITGDRLVVLSPRRNVDVYRIDDWRTSEYTRLDGDADGALIGEAVMWYQGASFLYRSGMLGRDRTQNADGR